MLCTAVDVTERRLFDVRLASMAAQAAAAYRRFELALEDSPISVFEQDAALRYTFMYNPPPGNRARGLHRPDRRRSVGETDLRKLQPLKRRVWRAGRATPELELEVGGARRFYALRLEPKTRERARSRGWSAPRST